MEQMNNNHTSELAHAIESAHVALQNGAARIDIPLSSGGELSAYRVGNVIRFDLKQALSPRQSG